MPVRSRFRGVPQWVAVAALGAVVLGGCAPGDAPAPDQAAAVGEPEGEGIMFGTEGVAGTTNGPDSVEVGVWVDYRCPPCAQFDELNGPVLEDLLAEGEVTVVLHPVSILDRLSQGTDYSTRAAAAVRYAAVHAPENAWALHEALFVNQPEVQLTNEEIAALAVEAGVSREVAGRIADGTAHASHGVAVEAATAAAAADEELVNPQLGRFGTPTITVDGERFAGDWTDPRTLAAKVDDARG